MLSDITIKGYKSIRQLQLELNPINLFIGANGVGKTNFLSFFKFVNNIYEQRLRQYSMQSDIEKLLYYGSKNTEEIVGQLNFTTGSYSFVLESSDKSTLFLKNEHFTTDAETIMDVSFGKESQFKDYVQNTNVDVAECLESFRTYHFHDTGKGSPLRTSANINDNRFLKTDGDNLPAFLYMLKEKYPKALQRMELTIRSVMPYFERFSLEPFSLDGNLINIVWSELYNHDKYFDANDLSDGSLRFIALTALLMQPEPPRIVIIDEPELGLHPVAINKLAGMIKSAAAKGSQIIISTQSVSLINNFEPEDIITVDRREGQSVFERLDEENLQDWLNEQ